MRKLRVLLSAGTMLGMAAGVAHAEMFPQNAPGSTVSPSGVGMLATPSGFVEVGSPYTGGQGQQYTPTASAYNLSPFSTPAPGTVNLRFDLRLDAFPQVAWWTGMNGNSGVATVGNLSSVGNKQSPYGINGFVRIDIGLDGMTKQGIRYGAFTEIRENTFNLIGSGGQFNVGAPGSAATAAPTFLNSVTTASATSSGTSSFNQQNTLYVRQAWAYIGTDNLGIIRIGQGFSSNSLMQLGLGDEFDDGGWVAIASSSLFPSAIAPTWPWADSGNEYQAARIGYLSPVVAGFDLTTTFAPNNLPMFNAPTCSAATAYAGCISQSSSNLPSDIARYRNEFEIGLRYRNSIGPVGLAIAGVWTHSAATEAGPFTPAMATVPRSVGLGVGNPSNVLNYNGLNMGMIGAEVSLFKYLAIGSNVLFGAYNGSWGLQNNPVCVSATLCQDSKTMAIAWTAGVRYTIPTLPMTVGTHYFNYKYQGQPGLPTQRVSQGVDVGATYGLGPGAVIVAEYLWGQNTQGGFNFLTNADTGEAATLNNKVQVQTAILGMSLRF